MITQILARRARRLAGKPRHRACRSRRSKPDGNRVYDDDGEASADRPWPTSSRSPARRRRAVRAGFGFAQPAPRRHNGIEIDYVAGYRRRAEDVPADLQTGRPDAGRLLVRAPRRGDRRRLRRGGAARLRPVGRALSPGAAVSEGSPRNRRLARPGRAFAPRPHGRAGRRVQQRLRAARHGVGPGSRPPGRPLPVCRRSWRARHPYRRAALSLRPCGRRPRRSGAGERSRWSRSTTSTAGGPI